MQKLQGLNLLEIHLQLWKLDHIQSQEVEEIENGEGELYLQCKSIPIYSQLVAATKI
jgi:hypothetical protein